MTDSKLIQKTIIDYIDLVDSSAPAPGGGSASALISSIGVALGRMVSHLTISKKSFKELPNDISEKHIKAFETLLTCKDELLKLVDKDAEAFLKIMESYKLPKGNEDEINIRKEAIQLSTINAIEVPIEIASVSLLALKQLVVIIDNANKHAISDAGSSAFLLEAGIKSSLLNVDINLTTLNDKVIAKGYANKAASLIKEGSELSQSITYKVKQLIQQA